MNVAVFNFAHIDWKVIPRYVPIVVQNLFSITPKPARLFGLFIHEVFGVNCHPMFSKFLQCLIATKCISKVNPGMRLDMGHESLCRGRFHDFGVSPAVPLRQANAIPLPHGQCSRH